MSLNPQSKNYLTDLTCKKRQQGRSVSPLKARHKNQSHYDKVKNKGTHDRLDKSSNFENKNQKTIVKDAEFPYPQPRLVSRLLYSRQGYMFGYLEKQGRIAGRVSIVFPQGIVANCTVNNGQIHGWAVICKKDVFYNICQFKKGFFEGQQFTYDIKCGLMLQSFYKGGKLHSIRQCFVENAKKFQKVVNNKIAYEILQDTLNNTFFHINFPCVQSKLGNYYGQKVGEIPNGLGVLFTGIQTFYGQFQGGLLSGSGTISFQNGNYYIGQLQYGLAKGVGQYFTNGSLICKYNDITINSTALTNYVKISSYLQNESLSRILKPIINFYIKLKQIHIKRLSQKYDKEASYVDIKLANQQQEHGSHHEGASFHQQGEETDRKYSEKQSSSFSQPQKKDGYLAVSSGGLSQYTINNLEPSSQNIQKQDKYQKNFKRSNTDRIQTDKQLKKNVKNNLKLSHLTPKSKGQIINDYDWNQIIQQLQGEESVGRQDGFLQPTKQQLKQSEAVQFPPKPNYMNSRINRQNIVKIKEDFNSNGTEKQEKQLNRIIGKLTQKKQ